MRTLVLAGISLAVSSVAIAQQTVPTSATPTPRAAFAAFEQQNGGASNWVVQWHPATGTPGTIYGRGLKIDDWRENSLGEARRHAVQLLKDQQDLLGLGTSDFAEMIGSRMGRTWSFTFAQSFRGVPAIGGRADVRINMRGVVAMLGSRAWPIPANFNTVPALTANIATAAAWAEMGGEPAGNAAPPRLVIWGDMASQQLAPFALAWEISVHDIANDGGGKVGRYYVDAQTGRVLHFQNDKHDCLVKNCTPKLPTPAPTANHPTVTVTESPRQVAAPTITTVTVMAWTRVGVDATDPLQNVPLQNLEVAVPGIGTEVTDQNGQFDIDISAPVTITINALDGLHFAQISGVDGPNGSVTVNPGVNATIQLLTSNATTNQAAHTTAAYWTDRSNVWARTILGNSSALATASNIGIAVNIPNTCNAYYTGNTTNYYQAGGSCANTAFSTVIAHEWGHGLDDRYGGIANSNAEGLSEGWGDIMGMYLLDTPLLGSGFQNAGVPLRDGNNTRIWPYSSTSPHGAGQVWMGWAWRFREALRASIGAPAAIQLSDQLVLGSIVANASTRQQAVLEVFLADDDDGNVLNGTPHYAELESASIQKGIPYPQIQVVALAHTPLGDTTLRLQPREVGCTATEVSETVQSMQIIYDDGTGPVTRNMHPTGNTDQWRTMLPGLDSGSLSYRIECVHTGGTITLPATGDYTYTINTNSFAGFYNEGFEGGANGWTSGAIQGTNDWQLGTPDGRSGSPQGINWSDPSSAAAGVNAFANDLGIGGGSLGNGRYQNNVDLWLRSPTIDCSNRTGVRLRFRRWLTVQDAAEDQASIWVNGQQLWQNPVGQHTVDTAWQTIDLQVPWADNNPAVQVEFRLVTGQGVNLGGWNIDTVEFGETVVPDNNAELRFLPEQVVQGAPMTLTVTTPGNSRPYLLVIGDTIGPILVPGFPALLVGGNYAVAGGTTDASGNDSFSFNAPTLAGPFGQTFFSQVLTVDATFTNFVTSNRGINWITLTP